MKIAVLISGELRTFDRCRQSMGFLNDPSVTVFVSTWKNSKNINEVLKLEHVFDTSEEDLRQVLGDVNIGGILVEDSSLNEEDRYNSPMVHRWIEGMKMIGDDFDFIIVVRPDMLFLTTDDFLNKMKPTLRVTMKFVNSFDLKNGRLQDVIFAGSPILMRRIFNSSMLKAWQEDPNHDWHTWFFSYVRPKVLGLECVGWPVHWGRPNMGINPTYREAQVAADVWRDSVIAKQIQTLGRHHTVQIWGDAMVGRVEKMVNDGFFENYAKILKEGCINSP